MQIRLYYIGKSNKHIYTESETIFTKRLSNYCKFSLHPLTPLKLSKSLSVKEIRLKEQVFLKSKLPDSGRLILMDEKGKHFDSRKFSNFIEKQSQISTPLNFVIGGAYGFSESLKQSADHLISLSSLTFPHHLARIVLLEQLYRAYSIINNEPYHNS